MPGSPVRAAVVLPDGATVDIEPMRAGDAERLDHFHHTLSGETIRLRFFGVHPDLSDQELHRFTHVDHVNREALVAVHGGEIVGVARFDRLRDGGNEAEVAFVVADPWQGRGLGTVLFERLAGRARVLGISRFVADTLFLNRRMLAVFRATGLPHAERTEGSVVHVVLELDPPAAPTGVSFGTE
jgi:GNAT superfamily N-acetyltransferase